MTVPVQFLHPQAVPDHVGFIPMWLDERNPKSAKQQIHENYGHGGGWFPMIGFKMHANEENVLHYPGDPPMKPLAVMRLREERVFVYEYGVVAIVQPNGSFEAARID